MEKAAGIGRKKTEYSACVFLLLCKILFVQRAKFHLLGPTMDKIQRSWKQLLKKIIEDAKCQEN